MNTLLRRLGLLAVAGAWASAIALSLRSAGDGLAALRSGDPRPDPALGGLAASLGLVLLGWTALAVACALAEQALPAGGAAARTAARLGRRITPGVARRALVVAVGAALASATLPAHAQAATASAPAVPAAAGGSLDPGWFTPRAAPAEAVDVLDPAWAPAAPPSAVPPPAPPASATAAVQGGRRAPESRSRAAQRPAQPALDPTWSPPGRLRAGAAPVAAVVVRRGDTLWDLAARHLGPAATDAEIAAAWPHWFTANRAVLGPDPDVLLPGARLVPPAT